MDRIDDSSAAAATSVLLTYGLGFSSSSSSKVEEEEPQQHHHELSSSTVPFISYSSIPSVSISTVSLVHRLGVPLELSGCVIMFPDETHIHMTRTCAADALWLRFLTQKIGILPLCSVAILSLLNNRHTKGDICIEIV